MTDAAKVQAMPVTTPQSQDVLESLRGVVPDRIFAQLEDRVALGVRKYGTRLQTHNGRDVLLDIRQEALDGIMYSQQGVLQGKRVHRIREAFLAIIVELDELEAV